VLFYLLYTDVYFSKPQCLLLVFQIVIITFLLPMTFFYLLRVFGKVDTIMLSDINQRKIPLLLQMALTSILIKESVTIDRFPELFFFFLAGLLSTFLAFMALYIKIKASIHMIGLSAVTFFVLGLSMHNQTNLVFVLATLFFLNGLVASSRLQMKAHTLKELTIGFLIGGIPQIAVWFLWL
jgi:hypothetical protein